MKNSQKRRVDCGVPANSAGVALPCPGLQTSSAVKLSLANSGTMANSLGSMRLLGAKIQPAARLSMLSLSRLFGIDRQHYLA